MIPQFKVRMAHDAISLVKEVLDSGFIGQGSKVDYFEELLQEELKTDVKPVTVNSCTSSIDLALDLIGVDHESEIISTPQTCFASQVGALKKKLIVLLVLEVSPLIPHILLFVSLIFQQVLWLNAKIKNHK